MSPRLRVFILHPSSFILLTVPFSTRIKVRFGDTDPAGLVYYPNIFHYFHIAMEEFFAVQCGYSYAQLLVNERIGFPTVNIQTEFHAPILYGEEIDIEVFVSRPGRTSAIFEYQRLFRRRKRTRTSPRR